MILPKSKLISIYKRPSAISFLLSFSISFTLIYSLLSATNKQQAYAVVYTDGYYTLKAAALTGGGGINMSSTDTAGACGANGSCKIVNFTLGEVVGARPQSVDTASVCETGGSGICKINPGWFKLSSRARLPNAGPTGTTSVSGRFGYARSFNGTSDHISLGNNGLGAMTGSFTIEAWVKTTSVAQQTIISEYQSGSCQDGRFYIKALDGTLVFDNGNGTVNTGNTPVNDGVWHHVAYVYNYNNATARGMTFVDGIPGSSTTAAGWRNTCSTTPVRIGAEVGANWFKGTMDNVRVYDMPIADFKMKELYYNGFITGCTTGTGYTPPTSCTCTGSAYSTQDGNCGMQYCPAC